MGSKGQLEGARLVDAALQDSSVEAVWKMYSAARASLPYKERVDNLTWRMLGMRMRSVRVEERSSVQREMFVEAMDVDPMNTVLRSPAPENEPFSLGQSGGFLSSAALHDQFDLFDTGFDEHMDDQLLMDFSRSSSDSYARDVVGGSPDPSNFLDHFFPSSIMGDGTGSVVPATTAKPKKLRNCTVTQARRGSGVKKKPQPLRNASTTSLTSLNSDLGTPGPSVPQDREPAKDGKNTRCSNCHTKNTPLWRRDPAGNPLCNACGLFLKLHGVVRPLSLKTDVIKKRQRNSNTSKQSKSTSPNLEDPRPTRKPGSRRKSTANGRETSSISPVTMTNSLSRVNSNLETYNDTHDFNNNITNNTNDDNNTNNSHFDFFPQADMPTIEDSRASSRSSKVGIGTGIDKPPGDDESRPKRNDTTGNTNWEWLSLSL